MMPSMFKADATKFNTLGIGRLTRCVSCIVKEEINGAYELEMTVLSDEPFIEYIQVSNIIAVKPNMTDPVQAFVIEEIKRNIKGEIEIYGTHVAQHRAKLIPVGRFAASALAGVIAHLNTRGTLEPSPFTFKTDMTSTSGFAQNIPKSLRDVMGGSEGSILDVYGGEYSYNNFDVLLTSKRGKNAGARVIYGKNMTSFDQENVFDWDDSATGVLPYWATSEGVADVIGDIQYSRYVNLYPYNKTVTVDFSDKFDEMPTKAELEAVAATWINSKGLPSMTLEVGLDQYDMTFAEVNSLQLGDAVTVVNSMYNVNYQSRVVGYEFNVLAESYNSLTVGTKKLTIAEVIAQTAAVTIKKEGLNVSQESSGTLVVG